MNCLGQFRPKQHQCSPWKGTCLLRLNSRVSREKCAPNHHWTVPRGCSKSHNQTPLPDRSQGEGFGWHMPAPTNCLQHRTGAALTHFSSGWIQGEMLVGFLFQLLLYLHLLFYSISTDKNKSVLGEAAQMEALRVGLR